MTHVLIWPERLGTLRFLIDAVLGIAPRVGGLTRTNIRDVLTIKETSCRGSIFNYTCAEA